MTKIPWTDETWNPVVGCTKIAEGCRNCYARKLHNMRHKAYLNNKRVPIQYAYPFHYIQKLKHRLEKPLYWRRPRMIFVCSMGDLFHEKVPFEFIDEVYAVIWELNCKYFFNERVGHTVQILTKRAKRMLDYYNSMPWPRVSKILKTKYVRNWGGGRYACPEILHIGTSISTQNDADRNIPHLLQVPAAVRFVSVEPMLERITPKPSWLGKYVYVGQEPPFGSGKNLDWVIVGCESGQKRRPCKLEWVKDLIEQCDAAQVPVFVKQLSIDGRVSHKPQEWPERARRREWPHGSQNRQRHLMRSRHTSSKTTSE